VRGLAGQIEQGDNALLDGGRQGRDARRTGLVAQQAFDSLGHKLLLPTPDCCLACARAAPALRRAAAVCRQQHDVRSPHMLLSGIPICHDRHEPFAISGTYLDDDARAPQTRICRHRAESLFRLIRMFLSTRTSSQ
jgi:hypothetical protein